MRLIVAVRRVIDELVRDGELEVRRAGAVARALSDWLEELGRLPGGRELTDWLLDHAMVDEVFADEDSLGRRVEQHLGDLLEPPVAHSEARHEELEQGILESPDNPEAYLVYSDWLQEAGDPLGELIALGVAAQAGSAKDRDTFDRFLRKNKDRFLGRFAHLPEAALKLVWRHGLVREVEVDEQLDESGWSDLLGLRILLGVERLRARLHHAGYGESVQRVRELAPSLPPTCRALCLANFYQLDPAQLPLPATVRDLELRGTELRLTPASPSLDAVGLYVAEVEAAAPVEWGVSELRIGLATMSEILGAVAFPAVETLVLDLGGGEPEAVALSSQLSGGLLGQLRRLAITNGYIDPALLGLLAAAATNIESLEIVDLALGDEGATAIAEHLETLGVLRTVDASNNELSAAGLERLAGAGVEVVSRRQDRPGSGAVRRIRRFAGTRFRVAEPLANPKKWQELGVEGDICWGHYTGTEPYELFVRRDLSDYSCSCPSSDQPCKHVVALALIAVRHELPERPWSG